MNVRHEQYSRLERHAHFYNLGEDLLNVASTSFEGSLFLCFFYLRFPILLGPLAYFLGALVFWLIYMTIDYNYNGLFACRCESVIYKTSDLATCQSRESRVG